MYFDLLSDRDMKAIDALIDVYGGAKSINDKVSATRDYKTRKKIAVDKGYGEMLKQAEEYTKNFPKVEDYISKEGIKVTKKGVCTTQVSGFQGSRVTLDCLRRIAQKPDILFPTEICLQW